MSNRGCHDYVQEVLKFRRALNLTSVDNERDFIRRFIEPSLAMAEQLPEEGRMLDIGSGMGVPGVPILISKPGLVGVLVERRKKRAEFLRHLVRTLKLNAEVYDADINHLSCLHVDICVARAVTNEEELLVMCSKHVNPGAVAVLPVPRASKHVDVEGWGMNGEYYVPIGSNNVEGVDDKGQVIRCYHYD